MKLDDAIIRAKDVGLDLLLQAVMESDMMEDFMEDWRYEDAQGPGGEQVIQTKDGNVYVPGDLEMPSYQSMQDIPSDLVIVDTDGAIITPSSQIVASGFALENAYPNPFNPSTTVDVYVPADGFVSLTVYNVMGQKVDVIHSGSMSEGNHSITWNASSLTSGMYFVRAESTSGVAIQKVMLMK